MFTKRRLKCQIEMDRDLEVEEEEVRVEEKDLVLQINRSSSSIVSCKKKEA